METSQVKLKADILYWAYPYLWQSVKYLHICIENASTIYIWDFDLVCAYNVEGDY
jgi:hypothetical protein